MSSIGTSQEGSDESTIREIALVNKRCGVDIQHIGDAGWSGVALPKHHGIVHCHPWQEMGIPQDGFFHQQIR